MGKEEKILILLGILIIFVTIYGGFSIYFTKDIQDNACKEIGFEEYKSWDGVDTCKDTEGNLYFVDMECKNQLIATWKAKCSAREIEVGSFKIKI